MKRFNKVLFAVLAAVFICPVFTACTDAGNGDNPPATTPKGLIVNDEGVMLYDGEEFYGAGVNYYDMFTGIFTRQWDLSVPLTALEVLKSYDVKVIRFSTLPFYYRDFGYYTVATATYWSKLDELIARCEELEIGLIPSFFWELHAVSNYFDEGFNVSLLNANSKTRKFIAEYTEIFVKRYVNSPAVYGWEFSNECVLSTDINNYENYELPANTERESRTAMEDNWTLEGISAAYKAFAEVVKANDPYGRIISTGDTNPRASQYNQWKYGSWTADTLQQHQEVLEIINPSPVNTISQHQYSDGTLEPGEKVAAVAGLYNTWEEFFSYLKTQSSRLGLACYVGEVGYSVSNEGSRPLATIEMVEECMRAVEDAAVNTKMQLVLMWNYDPRTSPSTPGQIYDRGTGIEYSWNEKMPRGEAILNTVKNINERFAALAAAE